MENQNSKKRKQGLIMIQPHKLNLKLWEKGLFVKNKIKSNLTKGLSTDKAESREKITIKQISMGWKGRKSLIISMD